MKVFMILFGVLVIAAFLRLVMLSSVPNGLEQDETSIGYNAYSILKTGKDEHGVSFPVYFQAFGEYKLPGYIYAAVGPIAVLGPSVFSVRLIAALAGILSVVGVFLFLREIVPKEKFLAVVSAAILAVLPWHLHFSRGAFEVSLTFCFIVFGLWLYLLSVRKKSWTLLASGLFLFLLSMFTYNIARVFTPVLLIMLFVLYKPSFALSDARKKMLLTVLVALAFVPYALTLFSIGGYGSTTGTLLFSSPVTQGEALSFRSFLIAIPTWFVKPFFNQFALLSWQYLEHIASYFSVSFFFLTGSSHGNHGIGTVGQSLLVSLPFFLIGIYQLLKRHDRFSVFLLLVSAAVIFIASLTREAPHATRGFFLVMPLAIVIGVGVVSFWYWTRHQMRWIGRISLGIVSVLVVWNLAYYFTSYYIRFPVEYAQAWRSEDSKLASFLKEHEQAYDAIIVDSTVGNIYTSLLFQMRFDPAEYQESVVYTPADSEGFLQPERFGKYVFEEIDWDKDYGKRVLYVTTLNNKPETATVLQEFFYPKRPVVSVVGADILQYPVREHAYVIAEKK